MNTTKLVEELALLENLTSEQQPQWGRMTPQHMVEHLMDIVRLGRDITPRALLINEERLPAARHLLFSNTPFPRGAVNPFQGPALPPLRYALLEEAQNALREEIARFYDFFSEHPDATPTHPYFGLLTYPEWEHFQQRHFRHHFTQFGLLPDML